MPGISSDGIQETEIVEDSYRTANSLLSVNPYWYSERSSISFGSTVLAAG
jgi:hypothetical protein